MAEITYIRPAFQHGLNVTPSLRLPEGSKQTFYRGAPLMFSGGYVVEATPGAPELIGFSLENGHNCTASGDKYVSSSLALPGQVFEGNISVSATDVILTPNKLGGEYGIDEDVHRPGVWFVDVDFFAAPRVKVIGFKDAVGERNGRVFFVVLDRYAYHH